MVVLKQIVEREIVVEFLKELNNVINQVEVQTLRKENLSSLNEIFFCYTSRRRKK